MHLKLTVTLLFVSLSSAQNYLKRKHAKHSALLGRGLDVTEGKHRPRRWTTQNGPQADNDSIYNSHKKKVMVCNYSRFIYSSSYESIIIRILKSQWSHNLQPAAFVHGIWPKWFSIITQLLLMITFQPSFDQNNVSLTLLIVLMALLNLIIFA